MCFHQFQLLFFHRYVYLDQNHSNVLQKYLWTDFSNNCCDIWSYVFFCLYSSTLHVYIFFLSYREGCPSYLHVCGCVSFPFFDLSFFILAQKFASWMCRYFVHIYNMSCIWDMPWLYFNVCRYLEKKLCLSFQVCRLHHIQFFFNFSADIWYL